MRNSIVTRHSPLDWMASSARVRWLPECPRGSLGGRLGERPGRLLGNRRRRVAHSSTSVVRGSARARGDGNGMCRCALHDDATRADLAVLSRHDTKYLALQSATRVVLCRRLSAAPHTPPSGRCLGLAEIGRSVWPRHDKQPGGGRRAAPAVEYRSTCVYRVVAALRIVSSATVV